jgi:predicted nucleic acid-binding protein
VRKLPRIYWDACTWIAYIGREMPTADSKFTDRRFEMCREVLKDAQDGNLEIVTSTFTLAEVCKRKEATGQAGNLSAFFDQPFILLVDVIKPIASRAQAMQLAGLAGLKPPDAIHLASAIWSDVSTFHTFDKRLLDLSGNFTVKSGKALQIMKPTEEKGRLPLLEGIEEDDDQDER